MNVVNVILLEMEFVISSQRQVRVILIAIHNGVVGVCGSVLFNQIVINLKRCQQ